jgi:hypothetical protein
MRSRRLLALALAGALGTAGLGPGGAGARDVPLVEQRYRIAATLDVATGRLDADMELTLTNRSTAPLREIHLAAVPRALGFLTMETVTVDGRAAETEWTTSIALRVPLGSVAPGETTVVEVPFRLDVERPPDAFTARLSRENGVLSFGQWFPILSTEHEVHGIGDPRISFTAASIRLELTTTTALARDAVACPGRSVAPETTGTAWVCEVERVRDFSFAVNPRYRLTTADAAGHEIRVYTETVAGSRTAALAADGLTRLEELFGPYPWGDLVLAEVGSATGFSMEYPRMIHLTRDKVADPYVVFHEVAHQWFYAQVGNDQQAEPWVDEAWADFSARLLMGIGENACSTRPVDASVFEWEAGPTSGGDWTGCDGYFHAVFYQGTEFLTAVRGAMGDHAFFGAMREWVERHRHGFVTGDALLRHLLRRADADLLPIYRRYLSDPDPRPYRSRVRLGAPGGPVAR